MKHSFFVIFYLLLSAVSLSQSLSSVEVYKQGELQKKFIMASWNQEEVKEKVDYYKGHVLHHMTRQYDSQTKNLISQELRGTDGKLSSSEKYIYENGLLVALYFKNSKDHVTGKIVIDYDEDRKPVRVQRLNGETFAQAIIRWDQKHALIRYYKNEKYVAHMTYHFSLQGLTLNKPNHFKSLFKICPMLEFEPGIKQHLYKVDSRGYKVEVERAVSHCQKNGDKLLCKGEFFNREDKGQLITHKKIETQYIKNPKPQGKTYGPMFEAFDKPWLAISSNTSITGQFDAKTEFKMQLNERGMVDSYDVQVLLPKMENPETTQATFNYNNDGSLERVINPNGEVILKYQG